MLNGLLLLDKPQGFTSHDLVARVRRILNMSEVGHCGTLDPMATGLMVLTLGKALKLSQFILERDKHYKLRAKLGVITDSLDATGKIVEEHAVDVSADQLRVACIGLQGELELPVPKYSAVKIDGQKLYEYARKNEEIALPVRRMHFYDLKVHSLFSHEVELELRCSKGSYVRSWVQALGERLGTGATLMELRRLGSEPYQLSEGISLEELEKGDWHSSKHGFVDIVACLPEYKTIRVEGIDLTMMRNGQISRNLKAQMIATFQLGKDKGIKVVSKLTGELIALVGLEPGKGFTVRRVFPS